jgi:hypothetical protein
MEPIARFIPPVASTTMVEKPMTMSMPSEREIVKRLKGETKPGASVVKTTQNSRTMAARPIRFDCSASQGLRRDGLSFENVAVMTELVNWIRTTR